MSYQLKKAKYKSMGMISVLSSTEKRFSIKILTVIFF